MGSLAAAVETGSFAAAGRKLGVSASAVAKAVDRLEARVGVRLINRTTRSLAPTGEGVVLTRYAARILRELQDAEQELELFQGVPRGHLRVSVPTVMGRRIVLPALKDFKAAFPQIVVEINLDDLKVDVIGESYDLVLRLGELDDSTFQARALGPHMFTTCAAPDYLTAHGTPLAPADLHDHCCIHYRFPTTGREETWAFKGPALDKPVKPDIVLNDGEALGAAALGGLGIIQAPSYLVSDEIREGRLVPVLTDYTDHRGSVWLLWPPRPVQPPKLRAFIDFMAIRIPERLSAYV
ncbi:LysR family transcriptional regulator [uncultured Stenotrophomonas sp.]|uniref:LysR family transcriptional regulator n=1 Tax=uncultured Stenotrophomonas sp. TaxID=165438 RepID=UPI0025E5A873|nr:LysR family transcriptional regulator [uncultured Stenotrophomonas sp.]